MAVKIRLKRMGRKKSPFYRLVVAHKPFSTHGRFIENIGTYDPNEKPAKFELSEDRLKYWLSVGARPSETVERLLGEKGLMPKVKKVPRNPGVSKKQKAQQAQAPAPAAPAA